MTEIQAKATSVRLFLPHDINRLPPITSHQKTPALVPTSKPSFGIRFLSGDLLTDFPELLEFPKPLIGSAA